MPFTVVKRDILEMTVDAIVNSTNRYMEAKGHSSVDAQLHRICGLDFDEECQKLKNVCKPGEAVYTGGGNSHFKYVIHTIASRWDDGNHGEKAILRSCYRRSLEVATELGCKSVAFPLIASGNRKIPIKQSYEIAADVISEYVTFCDDLDVYLVLYGEAAERMNIENKNDELERYLQKHRQSAVAQIVDSEDVDDFPRYDSKLSLEECLNREKDGGFSSMLIQFMNEKGFTTQAMVYRKAKISKGYFHDLITLTDDKYYSDNENEIKNKNRKKQPSMQVVVRIALVLKLTYDETVKLLASAGLRFSNSSDFDVIIAWHLQNEKYDLFAIDICLYTHGYLTLFSSK